MTRRPTPSPSQWVLASLSGFVSVAAVFGGVGLIRNGMGMPPEWLDGLPVDTWVLPGVALLVTVALPQAAICIAAAVRHRWAIVLGVLGGTALVLWIVVQVLVLERYFFLQPVIAGFGVAEVLIAWWWSAASARRYADPMDEPAGRPRRAFVPAEESPDSTGHGGG